MARPRAPLLTRRQVRGTLRGLISPPGSEYRGRSDMSKVPAFHTTSEEYSADHRAVYHDNNKCGYGAEIKPVHRVPGTGGHPRCDRCGDLAEAQQ